MEILFILTCIAEIFSLSTVVYLVIFYFVHVFFLFIHLYNLYNKCWRLLYNFFVYFLFFTQSCGTLFLIVCSQKRAISDWLIVPNTKWCGRGQLAEQYSQLGGASKADKCCRRHDYCRFNIHGLTTKWDMFNYRPFTISHCNCDKRLAHSFFIIFYFFLF